MSRGVRVAIAVLGIVVACTHAPHLSTASPIADLQGVLETSTDRDALRDAAVALARSDDPRASSLLAEYLRRQDFLSRLDDLTDPHLKTRRLKEVFDALADHPSPATESLCLALAVDETFLADPDRLSYLLVALAAVRPMSEHGAALFARSNGQGYLPFNMPLLVRNGSERALELFASMVQDTTVPARRRVDALHVAVVSHRTERHLLAVVAKVLDEDLDGAVAVGLIESLFDYRPREWYGTSGNPPEPPRWETASDGALKLLIDLAGEASNRRLPAPLAERVATERDTIRRILHRRRQ